MLPTISLYVFKSRVNKRGMANIYLRFTNDRKSSYISTKISVPYSYWDPLKQKVKPGYKLANVANMLLERKLSEIREQLMITSLKTKHISSQQAKRTIFGKTRLSFFALCDEYTENFKLDHKIGSADRVKSIFLKFEQFLGGRKATFYDIDEKVLLDYQHYLRDKLKNMVNTVHSNMKTIRRIFSIAINKGIITAEADPFTKMTLKTEKTVRPFLLKEEVADLAKLDLPLGSLMEKCRDMFVWTILTGGLRVSDMLLLRKSNIDGPYLNIIIRKTGTPHRIKMPNAALVLLTKYLDTIKSEDGFVFDLLPENLNVKDQVEVDRGITNSTSLYNKYLGLLAKKAGIKKKISSHSGRSTFATIAVQSGIDMRTVQGLLKHADIGQTAGYSKFVDSQADKALLQMETILS